MDFPKKFGRSIKNQEDNLPEGYSWEEMKDGIDEKMKSNPQYANEKVDAQKRIRLVPLIGMIVLAIVLISIYTCHSLIEDKDAIIADHFDNEDTNSNYSEHEELIKETINQSVDKVGIVNNTIGNAQKEGLVTNEENVKVTTKAVLPQAVHALHANDNQKHLDQRLNLKSKDVLAKVKVEDLIKNVHGSIADTDKIKRDPLYPDQTLIDEAIKQSQYQKELKKEVVRTLPIIRPMFIEKLAILNEIRPLTIIPATKISKRKYYNQLYLNLNAGSSFMIPNWQTSESQQEYRSFQKSLPGLSLGLRLEYVLSKRFSMTSGLTIGHYFTRLDYQGTKELEIEKDGQVIQIINNTTTGLSTEVLGTATVRVLQQREVRHYNRFKTLSIPLTFRYTIQKSKMSYGVGLGFDISLEERATGKYVSTQSIKLLEDVTGLKDQKVGMGILTELIAKYHISSKVDLSAGLMLNRQLTTWQLDSDISLQPVLLIGQLGISYRLN